MNVINEGEVRAQVICRLLNEVSVFWLRRFCGAGTSRRWPGHEVIDEGVDVVYFYHLARKRKRLVVADTNVQIAYSGPRRVGLVSLRCCFPSSHQIQLHRLRQGARAIDYVKWTGVLSQHPFVPKCGVIGNDARTVQTIEAPALLKFGLVSPQGRYDVRCSR
jgi:hypothetical protein